MKEDLDKQLDKVAGKLLKFIETGKDISDTKAADLLEKLMNQYLVDDLSGLDFYELEKVIDLANKISSVGIIELNIKKNPDAELESLVDPALEELGKEVDILVKKNTKDLINKVKEDKVELDKEGLDMLIDQCKDDTDSITYLKKKFYDKEQKKDEFDDLKNLMNAIFKTDNTNNTKMGRIDELLDIFDKRMPDRWITDLSEDAYKTLKETLDNSLSAAKISTEFIHSRSKEEQDKKKEKQIMMDLEDMLTKEEARDSLFNKKDVVCGNASIDDPFMCKGICSICSFNKMKEPTVVKKAMISQPMSGLSSKQIEEVREKAKKAVEDLGYEFVNTYFSDLWERKDELKGEGYKNLPIYFLSKAIAKMSRCDAVYFCKGWKKSIGCRIEHDIARSYGIPCFFEDPNEE